MNNTNDNMIKKMVNKIWYSIIPGEHEESNLHSILFLLIMSIAMYVGYQTANVYYLNYNYNINSGILIRLLKASPFIILLCIVYVKFLPKAIYSIESLYWMLFFLLTIIPTALIYPINGIADSKNVIVYIYTILITAIAGIYLVNVVNIKVPQIRVSKKAFWWGITIFIVCAYSFIFYKLRAHVNLASLFGNIYDVRLAYRKIASRFVDYFVQWSGNVINPFIFAYALRKKKVPIAVIAVVLELILYVYTAYKSILMVFFLAPFFGWFLSKGIRKSFIEKGTLAVLIIGVITGLIHKLSIYVVLVIRIFFMPSLIALEYYDFFWMYPKMKLAHSVLGHFFNNIYYMEPSFYMGSLYYNRPQMRLNTTWFADAYMNFGYVGIIVFALILFGILIFIKSMEKKDIYLVSAALFGGIITLFNAPLLTTLLTHGLGMGLLIVYLLPKEICEPTAGGKYE